MPYEHQKLPVSSDSQIELYICLFPDKFWKLTATKHLVEETWHSTACSLHVLAYPPLFAVSVLVWAGWLVHAHMMCVNNAHVHVHVYTTKQTDRHFELKLIGAFLSHVPSPYW